MLPRAFAVSFSFVVLCTNLKITEQSLRVGPHRKLAGVNYFPPPGCACKTACDATPSCQLDSTGMRTCPFASNWSTPGFPYFVASCVDAMTKKNLAAFSRFGATGNATAWKLPCFAHGAKADPHVSPCAIPEVAQAYFAASVSKTVYASTPPVEIALRLHVFDATGLTNPGAAAATRPWCNTSTGTYDTVHDNCLCANGRSGCVGSACVVFGPDSWYGASCKDCKCVGRAKAETAAGLTRTSGSSFTAADFNKTIAHINAQRVFGGVVTFKAAVFHAVKPTQAQWNNWAKSGAFNSLNSTAYLSMLNAFSVPHGKPAGGLDNSDTGPHTLTPYVELFVVPHAGPPGSSTAGEARGREAAYAWGQHPPTVMLAETSVRTGHGSWTLFAHELGHIFGLQHTFLGLETKALKKPSCDACVPAAGNGYTTGDGIADTPPTSSSGAPAVYAQPASVDDAHCAITFDSSAYCVTLPNGAGNMRNLMSYGSSETCQSKFTPGQVARMRCYLEKDFGQPSAHQGGRGAKPGLVVARAAMMSGSTTVTVSWLPPVSEYWCTRDAGCLKHYVVETRKSGSDAAWATVGTVPSDNTPVSRELAVPNGGADNEFRVVAVDSFDRRGVGNRGIDVGADAGAPLPSTAAPTATPTESAVPAPTPASDAGAAAETDTSSDNENRASTSSAVIWSAAGGGVFVVVMVAAAVMYCRRTKKDGATDA